MSEWKKYKLGEIASFKTGKLNSNAAVENGIYPFFTCSPITLAINEYAYDQKAILLAGNNAEGNFSIKYYEGKFNAYQRTYIIDSNEQVCDLKFLFYSLKLCLDNFKSVSQGTSTRFLTAVILNNFEILLPSIDNQKRITSILSSLDDKIDLLHRENTTLEAMAETLFRQWFIEEAKEDWEEGQLGDVCLYVTEKIDISNVDVDTYISTENMCPNKQGVVEASSIPENVKVTKYIQDDILLSNIRPYFKKIWLADRNGACSNDVLCIRSKSEDLKYFTYYTIRQDDFFDYVMLGAKGCKMPRGDKKHIMNWSIIIPTNDVLRRFNTIVENGMAKIRNNNKQIQVLMQTRDSLIPKLMSNEIVI